MNNPNSFKTSMAAAPCANCPVFCASLPCFPCVNFWLRRKAIENMNNYVCCQGYADFMCFKAGSCCDQGNPCCLCVESVCCPGLASSSTRMFVMDKRITGVRETHHMFSFFLDERRAAAERSPLAQWWAKSVAHLDRPRYALAPDPCDWKIIHCSNCMQMLACVCHILAMLGVVDKSAADLIGCVADSVFLVVMGCMNAQTALELAHRQGSVGPGGAPLAAEAGAATLEDKIAYYGKAVAAEAMDREPEAAEAMEPVEAVEAVPAEVVEA